MARRILAAVFLSLAACGGLQLKPDESLGPAAITLTRVQTAGKTVSAYLIFDKDYEGPLEMRLLDRDDEEGVEIGRSTVRVSERSGATYVDFIFDPRTPVHLTAAVRVKVPTIGGVGP